MSVNVGEIEVTIGGDTFKLEKSTEDAGKAFDKLDKKADAVSNNISNALGRVKLAVTAAVATLGYLVVSTINAAEALAQTAEKLGSTSEELGRLQFAATQTNLQVTDLTTGLTLLSRQLNQRDEMSEGVRTFQALGISVQDASGQMKSSSQVFVELADKFAVMKDGAAKTELAMNLFGRSGASLIPLLSQGSAALKAMGDEGVALGAVYSSHLVQASTNFNNSMDALHARSTGYVNLVTEKVLPVLQYIVDRVVAATGSSSGFAKVINVLAGEFKYLVSVGALVFEVMKTLSSIVYSVSAAIYNLARGQFGEAWKSITDGADDIGKSWGQLNTDLKTYFGDWAPVVTAAAEVTKSKAAPIIKSAEDIAKALQQMKLEHRYAFEDLMALQPKVNSIVDDSIIKMMSLSQMVKSGDISWREYQAALKGVQESSAAVFQEMLAMPTLDAASKQRELNRAVEDGVISWKQYQDATKSVNESTKQNMDSLVTSVSTALTAIFGKSKNAAIAAALINTFQGVTKALAELPPPFSYAQAALTAAMGFAQVQKIRSTTSSGGGGGGSAAPASAPAAAPQSSSSGGGGAGSDQTLFVKGISPSGMFSGEVVRDLASKLIDFQRDGGKVILSSN